MSLGRFFVGQGQMGRRNSDFSGVEGAKRTPGAGETASLSSSSSSKPSRSQARRGFEGRRVDRWNLVFSVGLMAAVLASYSAVTGNGFIDYDDSHYITENAQVKAGITWATVEWAFTTYKESNWHPLTWLSHALDCEIFGLNAAGHHGENVVLHGANAVLLFLLLQSATGLRWRSLMVAGLFALHPINVESVAWAAERKNVLSMLFFLLALIAYGWYARKRGRGRYFVVAGLFTLALLAKPQVITFPFLLLLWDYWPLGRVGEVAEPARGGTKLSWTRLAVEKLPLLLLSAASAVVTMEAQESGGAVKDLARYSWWLRVETAVISYVAYLGKAFWPAKLVLPYPHPTKLYPVWQVGAAVGFLVLITILVVRARKEKYLAVGWFWFLGSLVPMIGLVQVGEQAMADRYAYIPLVGLFVMVVWLVGDWGAARQIWGRRLAIPAVGCLLALGVLTYRQVGYWHDTESIWLRALALTDDNYIAHEELAGFLHRQGRTEEAIAQVRAVLAIRPDHWPANLILAGYEQRKGNLATAIERYEMVALHASSPGLRAKAYRDMGNCYRAMGDAMKAKESFEQSLALMPDQPAVMVRLGVMAQNNGELGEAVRQYSRALALQHSDVEGLLLAQALRQEGRLEEADAVFKGAARLSPDLALAQKAVESMLAEK
jgi:Tfp pilus assembly protein PilF